ncbi:hypothetical protein ACJBVY_08285 [Streptococcus suis]
MTNIEPEKLKDEKSLPTINPKAISNLVNNTALVLAVSSLQESIERINASSLASSALAANLVAKTYLPSNFNSIIDTKLINAISSSIPKINPIVNEEYLSAMNAITESVKGLLANVDLSYSKVFSDVAKILKKFNTEYSQEEIDEIVINVRQLAKNGWVIFFNDIGIYDRLRNREFAELEKDWIYALDEFLSEESEIQGIYEVGCYPATLLDSMLDCYESNNYYAAYSLATLAIDGALTRFSEILSDAPKMPVGTGAVSKLDKSLLSKSFADLGFFEWLYQFFKDTKRFTLDKPNRHMIGHGRWAGEISKTEFLKLFNVMLYISLKFKTWTSEINPT